MQDTVCALQNETAATNPAAQPQRAANMYYMTKLQIRSGELAQELWHICLYEILLRLFRLVFNINNVNMYITIKQRKAEQRKRM